MTIFPTNATTFVKDCVKRLRNRRKTTIIDADHGSGKTLAAAWAKKDVSSKDNNSQILELDGYQGASESQFAEHIASQLAIPSLGQKAREIICRVRSQMCRRHVGLVVIDNAQYLEPPCQEQVIRLLDISAYAPNHEVGLLALQSGGDFARALERFSYKPDLLRLPKLAFEEQLAFLVDIFPVLKTEQREVFESPLMADVLNLLYASSNGRPRTLVDILRGIQANKECPENPTLKVIRGFLKKR